MDRAAHGVHGAAQERTVAVGRKVVRIDVRRRREMRLRRREMRLLRGTGPAGRGSRFAGPRREPSHAHRGRHDPSDGRGDGNLRGGCRAPSRGPASTRVRPRTDPREKLRRDVRDFPRPRTPTQIRGGDGPPLAAAERAGGAIETEAKEDLRARCDGWGRQIDAPRRTTRVIERIRRSAATPPSTPPSPNPSANAPSSANYSPRAGSAIFPTVSTRAIATRRGWRWRRTVTCTRRVTPPRRRRRAPSALTKRTDEPDALPTRAECGVLWHVHTNGTGEPSKKTADADPSSHAPEVAPRAPVVSCEPVVGGVSHPPGAGMLNIVSALQHAFAHAVPSAEALDAVAALDTPVVEIGAGTGYWAALLEQRGVDVVALDATPPECEPRRKQIGGRRQEQILRRDVSRGAPGRTRGSRRARRSRAHDLLAVPAGRRPREVGRDVPGPLEGTRARARRGVERARAATAESWPRGCASPATPEGQTTSLEFQQRVEREFKLVKHVRLPNWPFCRDDLTVWVRVES